VADEVHGGGAGEVEILFVGGVPEVDAFSAHGGGEILAEGSAEDGGAGRGGGVGHLGIIALGGRGKNPTSCAKSAEKWGTGGRAESSVPNLGRLSWDGVGKRRAGQAGQPAP
jgi:hypothetical protein